MEYNVTYNDTVHKYTINIPKEDFEALKKKARSYGIYRVSIYLNAMIKRELYSKTGFSVQEIDQAQQDSERIASRDHRLERLNALPSWNKKYKKDGFIKLTIKRISNIICSKQLFFDFSKKNA